MSALSLEAFAKARQNGDLDLYLRPMKRAIRSYRRIEHPLLQRVFLRAKRAIKAFRALT